jgi:hypothetical protein
MQRIGKFMIYLLTTFHVPHYNDSLVIAVKTKAKESIYAVIILLFYILQKLSVYKLNPTERSVSYVISGL